MVHCPSGVLRSNRPRSREARLPQINRFGELQTRTVRRPGSIQSWSDYCGSFNLAVSREKIGLLALFGILLFLICFVFLGPFVCPFYSHFLPSTCSLSCEFSRVSELKFWSSTFPCHRLNRI
ncbi:hypothetical protein BJX68DRAFT_162219 [Aspergillus pseudodeflectus]|uniref:Uncharacterized protein n=1 Tax=Aspergillus pseudodeflectus TaxID=176178 RepID=A0ABR4L218_9EURO